MNACLSPTPTDSRFLPTSAFAHTAEQDRSLTVLRGPSKPIARLWSRVRTAGPHFRTLLLTGERGTGADTVAQLLHSLSPFRTGTFLRLDPAAAQRRLRKPRRLLREATGGVLYLPDVDQLPAAGQEALERLLRLNRLHPYALITSTCRDLRSLAAAGEFSPALAESLGSIQIDIPSLHDRREDIPLLAESLLREACASSETAVPKLTPGFLEAASQYDWPGNLDELRSAMSWLAAMPHTGSLDAHALESALRSLRHASQAAEAPAAVRMVKLDLVVQEHIRSVLTACQGNKLRASVVLGISRSTLYRTLEGSASQSMGLLA